MKDNQLVVTPEDYKFIEHEEEDWYGIELTTGKWKGVKYMYGTVSVKESPELGTATLHFTWNPIEVGKFETELNEAIIIYWRLPRLVLAMLVGASLAVAGAGYQGVFKNPLADPFLLGSAAGAGLGASFFIIFKYDVSFYIFETTQIAAFFGALFSVIIASLISRSVGGSISSLLLAGIATASFLTACQSFLMQKNINSMQEIYGWLIGRLVTSGWNEVLIILPYFLIGFISILCYSRQLDLLRFSNEEAKLLGGKPVETKIVVLVSS